MGRPAGWMQDLTGRGAMRSPGGPSLRNEIERLFGSSQEGTYRSKSEKSEKRLDCVTTCKTIWRVRFTMLIAVRLLDLDKLRSKVEIKRIAVTVNGSMAGRRTDYHSGYRLIFRTMNPCASLTKPYTRPIHSRARCSQARLVSCLRTGRASRVPRARAQAKAWAHVSEDVMISSRPEVEDRAVPGHWEGDLIIGLTALRLERWSSAQLDSPCSSICLARKVMG